MGGGVAPGANPPEKCLKCFDVVMTPQYLETFLRSFEDFDVFYIAKIIMLSKFKPLNLCDKFNSIFWLLMSDFGVAIKAI